MKTVNDIDNWFNGIIKQQVDAMPPLLIKVAKGNPKHIKSIAETIALRCCFNVKAIEKELKTILN